MKLPGVKNFNWKQFFIDHGEKLLFGGVALLGLGALGVSRWAPYAEKSPYGLLTDVAAAKKQHETSVWPDAERQEYDTQEDISAKARQLLSPLDDQQYAFGRTLPYMYWPVIPQKQLIEEPKWFAVERLEATTGRVLYAKAPSMDEALAALENPDAEGAEDEDEPQRNTPRGIDLGDFRPSSRRPQGLPGMEAPGLDAETYAPPEADAGAAPRGRSPRGRGAAGARGGSSSGARGSGGGARGGGARGGASSGAMPAPGVDFYGGSGMDMYGMEGGYGMAGPIEGVAKRFVSVRGVFPIKNQERELARALGLQSPSQLVNALQFVDFELERQRAVQGADPWAGSWEKVDIQIAHDVLNEQANFSADIVDPSVTNSVFTMPLPGRVIGEWDDEDASHPALTQFDLTEDAKKQQQWLQTKIAEYAARLEEEGKMLPQVGGFGSQQYDARQVGGMMMMNEGYMNEMTSGMGGMGMSGMAQPMAGRQGQTAPKVTKEDIKAMLSASGTYLLFRYLDFDVRPGNAYRYRVRLKVVNPSFGRDPGEAKDRYVVEEQYRFTEWSQPTAASIVPEDTRHFLVEIDQPVTNQADRATFEVFQWSDKFGTFVGEFLAVEPGQFIGGTAKTDVLDPAAQTFEEQDFTFTSNDVLVDIDRNAFNVASRPEMGVTDRRFRIPAQVLTVNEWGKLEVQDPVSTAGTRVAWENALKGLAEDFAHLKDKAATTGEAGMEYMEADMYGGAMSGGARGGANPLRRGRGRGAASGSSGDMMMEGMGGEGMGGGRPRPRQR